MSTKACGAQSGDAALARVVRLSQSALRGNGMTYRIAQISDTHLGREKPFFVANFLHVGRHLAASRPDLVLNSGDMSLDGSACEDDLAESRRLHNVLDLPVRYIPGNHDLGESQDAPPHAGMPVITAELRARYLRHFGPDYWGLSVPSWRVIAINAQLLASDIAAAADQLRFVRDAAAAADGCSVALFVHKPLFHQAAHEDGITGRFVNPLPRRQLLEALGENKPALIASGHVHQFLSHRPQGAAHHVWAPSTGFVLPDARQPVYGLKQTGYVEHQLHPDGSHDSLLVTVPGLDTLSIADFPEAYAQYEASAARKPASS
jgi:Icc protein